LGLPITQWLRIAWQANRTQRLGRFDDLPPASRSMACSNRYFGEAGYAFSRLAAFDLFCGPMGIETTKA